MPELPEVESLKNELQSWLPSEIRLAAWVFHRKDLRFRLPMKELNLLRGQKLVGFHRRAKYLLFEFETHFVLSHLGMTGSWRLTEQDEDLDPKHDHVEVHFRNGEKLIYNDPRRFGFIDCFLKKDLATNKFLAKLGSEPLELRDSLNFWQQLKKKKSPIKVAIMDQHLLVGVGNIYASEALFRAGIPPKLSAHRVSQIRAEALLLAIQEVLREAIQAGGSSIQDYKKLNGASGNFQNSHLVYGREGEACKKCGKKITAAVLAGRSTYWCANCQKK